MASVVADVYALYATVSRNRERDVVSLIEVVELCISCPILIFVDSVGEPALVCLVCWSREYATAVVAGDRCVRTVDDLR